MRSWIPNSQYCRLHLYGSIVISYIRTIVKYPNESLNYGTKIQEKIRHTLILYSNIASDLYQHERVSKAKKKQTDRR